MDRAVRGNGNGLYYDRSRSLSVMETQKITDSESKYQVQNGGDDNCIEFGEACVSNDCFMPRPNADGTNADGIKEGIFLCQFTG